MKTLMSAFFLEQSVFSVDVINKVDDKYLKWKLLPCNHLINSEPQEASHRMFFSLENLNTKTLDKKLDNFLKKTKCAAKVNLKTEFFWKTKTEAS